MQHQPLAFTLVKTVVTARDEARELSPALATAWRLMCEELSPAHRVMSEEVAWSPAQQSDLRFVIDGVRLQFEADPDLAGEILAFLSEVDTYADEEEAQAALLALGVTNTSGSAAVGIELPSGKSTVDVLPNSSTLDNKPLPAPPDKQLAEAPVAASRSFLSQRTRTGRKNAKLPALLMGVVTAAFCGVLALWLADRNKPSPPPHLDLSAYFALPEIELDSTGKVTTGVDGVPVDTLLISGDYESAIEKLNQRIRENKFASAEAKTAALLDLGALLLGQQRHTEAAITYLEALERLYINDPANRLSLGMTHLLISRAYRGAGRRVLSLAHQRQARHYFDQAQDIVQPVDLEQLQASEQLLGT